MTSPLRAEAFGPSAILVWCDPTDVLAIARRARERWPEAIEVVPAAESVLIDGVDVAAVDEVGSWRVDAGSAGSVSPRLVELATRYDGPDLADVASAWSVTPDEVARIHAAEDYTVAFCGFAPGFAYCTGLPESRAVPRRTNPRARVEPGSVALADIYTGVYPTASPGGWQVIGRTEAPLWDLAREEPALLTPGTTVRFVPL